MSRTKQLAEAVARLEQKYATIKPAEARAEMLPWYQHPEDPAPVEAPKRRRRKKKSVVLVPAKTSRIAIVADRTGTQRRNVIAPA